MKASFGPLLRLRQAAETLEVSEVTVRRLIRRGELPAVRIGGQLRVPQADLLAYITTQREPVA
jgi:excisionase family DNA binding protein